MVSPEARPRSLAAMSTSTRLKLVLRRGLHRPNPHGTDGIDAKTTGILDGLMEIYTSLGVPSQCPDVRI